MLGIFALLTTQCQFCLRLWPILLCVSFMLICPDKAMISFQHIRPSSFCWKLEGGKISWISASSHALLSDHLCYFHHVLAFIMIRIMTKETCRHGQGFVPGTLTSIGYMLYRVQEHLWNVSSNLHFVSIWK